VAIPAVDAEAADVVLVAELYGLFAGDAGAGGEVGADVFSVGPAGRRQDEDRPKMLTFEMVLKLR